MRAGVAIDISDKMDFKSQALKKRKEKEDYFILIMKQSIQQGK
jgi:hypothetical protein